MRDIRRRGVATALTATSLLVVAACSGGSTEGAVTRDAAVTTTATPGAQAAPPTTPPQNTLETDAAVSTTAPTTAAPTTAAPTTAAPTTAAPTTAAPPVEARTPATPLIGVRLGARPELMDPGMYRAELLPLDVDIDLAEPMLVLGNEQGLLDFADPIFADGSGPYRGVAFLDVDALNVGTQGGGLQARIAPTLDLTDWASSLEFAELVDTGSGTVGGRDARWWQLESRGVSGSAYPPLVVAGEQHNWHMGPNSTQQLWVIDADGRPFFMIVEAPTADFDDWAVKAQSSIIDNTTFGAATGVTVVSPASWLQQDVYGFYETGRAELTLVDTSRPTIESGDPVVVSAADERRLLVSIGYPADFEGGFGVDPAVGEFPLVVVGHALGGSGQLDSMRRVLVSHGYVVASVRFPESSAPGHNAQGVRAAPADLSFVIDQLLADPALAVASIDESRIGALGISLGGAAVYGLLATECCADSRIAAAVVHSGPSFFFDETPDWPDTPILFVGSDEDEVTPGSALLAMRDDSGVGSAFVLAEGAHLSWENPHDPNFSAVAGMTVAYFDRYLQGDEAVDLAATADLYGTAAGFVVWVPGEQ